MSPEEQYPSADDTDGATQVRECLVNARRRVDEGWSRNTYVGVDGEVCAVGAIFAEDGLDRDDVDEAFNCVTAHECNGEWFAWLSRNNLSATARSAIDLVNKVAARRHPEYDDARDRRNWSGPLEWVNQSWSPRSDGSRVDKYTHKGKHLIKAEVLAIYDEAVASLDRED